MEESRARGLEALTALFGERCERPAEPEEAGIVASVLPVDAGEVRRLAEIAARCSLRIVSAGGGTAPGEPAEKEGGVVVRYDLMRSIRTPERGAGWVEAEPGVTWLALDRELRRGGMGLAVYPTSAPRATVGGWLATDGIGVGSFEYGRLRENVLSASVVEHGGGLREVGGEELGYFFGPGRVTGIVVSARLRTRRTDRDRTFAAAFAEAGGVAGAVEDLAASGAPLWHLAIVSPVMAAARGLRQSYLLFGAYPGERDGEEWWELRRRVLRDHGGLELDSWETARVWGERFYPISAPGEHSYPPSSRPAPEVTREFVPLSDLRRALEARPGAALQCSVSRTGEALLLALGAQRTTPQTGKVHDERRAGDGAFFPTRVMVAVDGSTEAEGAARAAVELCEDTGSELHVAYVAPPPGAFAAPEAQIWYPEAADELEKIAERDGRPVLDEQVRKIPAGKVAGAHLRVGRADAGVVALAEELGAGLVVVGNRGRGPLRRALLGSVSDPVSRHAHCPVLVFRDTGSAHGPTLRNGRVLVAVDGSREAEAAASVAGELAAAAGARLHVAYCPDFGPLVPYPAPYAGDDWRERLERAKRRAREFVEERASRLSQDAGVEVEAHLRPGRAEDEILRLGEELDADLIVVGSRGLGGIKRALLGSVSAGVTRHARGPVLVVRKTKPAPEPLKPAARAGSLEG